MKPARFPAAWRSGLLTPSFWWRILLLAPLAALHAADAAPAKKPSVLFVIFDDLNNRLGCFGDPIAKSPNLDRLAARGTVFTRAICQQPICNPSRASFMTGQRPDTLRLWDIPTSFRELHPAIATMPQWFKQHGYFSQGIGKIYHNWSQKIQGDPESWSVPQVMHWDRHDTEKPVLPPGAHLPPNLAKDRECEIREVPDEAYFDGRIANLAIEALQGFAKKDQPFFLGVGFWKPHTPFNAPKRYWDMYRREDIPAIDPTARPKDAPDIAFHANHEILGDGKKSRTLDEEAKRELRHGYYAAMSYADAQLGKVLDALDELKLADNTIVVIVGDNGFQLGEHDCWGKMTLFGWDGRVPLIISAPGLGQGGAKTAALSELIDIFPTLTDLCGLPNPPKLDGISLVPVLKDVKATVKSGALTQHPRPALYWGGGPEALPQVMGYGLFTDRWNYHEWRDFKTAEVVARELYDGQKDPLETVNLAETQDGKALIPPLAAQIKSMTKGTQP